ncbi:DUF6234 family protein [Kitasatospora sp. NPDC049258]|uniref:DUF6234 family protein n=1 Tax=Kitasatospora sp. NPDC049258 TaxID=3155394 RepID=UPI003431ECB2
MTKTSPARRPSDRRRSLAADLLGGVALLALEVVVLLYVGFAMGMEQWAAQGQPQQFDHTGEALTVGAVAIAAAVLAVVRRRPAPVTAVTQALLALVAGFLALALAFPDNPPGRPDRRPSPSPTGVETRYGYGQCRSGGTSDECRYSGG